MKIYGLYQLCKLKEKQKQKNKIKCWKNKRKNCLRLQRYLEEQNTTKKNKQSINIIIDY